MDYTVADLATGRPPLGWKPDRRVRPCSVLEWATVLEMQMSAGDLVEVPGPHGIPELRLTTQGAWWLSVDGDAR